MKHISIKEAWDLTNINREFSTASDTEVREVCAFLECGEIRKHTLCSILFKEGVPAYEVSKRGSVCVAIPLVGKNDYFHNGLGTYHNSSYFV